MVNDIWSHLHTNSWNILTHFLTLSLVSQKPGLQTDHHIMWVSDKHDSLHKSQHESRPESRPELYLKHFWTDDMDKHMIY